MMLAGGEPAYGVLFFVACLSLYVHTLHPSIAGERFVTENARERWEANAGVVRVEHSCVRLEEAGCDCCVGALVPGAQL